MGLTTTLGKSQAQAIGLLVPLVLTDPTQTLLKHITTLEPPRMEWAEVAVLLPVVLELDPMDSGQTSRKHTLVLMPLLTDSAEVAVLHPVVLELDLMDLGQTSRKLVQVHLRLPTSSVEVIVLLLMTPGPEVVGLGLVLPSPVAGLLRRQDKEEVKATLPLVRVPKLVVADPASRSRKALLHPAQEMEAVIVSHPAAPVPRLTVPGALHMRPAKLQRAHTNSLNLQNLDLKQSG